MIVATEDDQAFVMEAIAEMARQYSGALLDGLSEMNATVVTRRWFSEQLQKRLGLSKLELAALYAASGLVISAADRLTVYRCPDADKNCPASWLRKEDSTS